MATVVYTVGLVKLDVDGMTFEVEAALSPTLPRYVILRTGVPEVSWLLDKFTNGHGGKDSLATFRSLGTDDVQKREIQKLFDQQSYTRVLAEIVLNILSNLGNTSREMTV